MDRQEPLIDRWQSILRRLVGTRRIVHGRSDVDNRGLEYHEAEWQFSTEIAAALDQCGMLFPLCVALAVCYGINAQAAVLVTACAMLSYVLLAGQTCPAVPSVLLAFAAATKMPGLSQYGFLTHAALGSATALLLAVADLGQVGRHVRPSTVTALRAGLALGVMVTSLPLCIGIHTVPGSAVDSLLAIVGARSAVRLDVVILSAIAVGVFMLTDIGRLPGIAVPAVLALGVAANHFGFVSLETVGDLRPPTASSPASFSASTESLFQSAPALLAFAILSVIELQPATIIQSGPISTSSNRRLLVRALVNTIAPIFGGLPVCVARVGSDGLQVLQRGGSVVAGFVTVGILVGLAAIAEQAARSIPIALLASVLIYSGFRAVGPLNLTFRWVKLNSALTAAAILVSSAFCGLHISIGIVLVVTAVTVAKTRRKAAFE